VLEILNEATKKRTYFAGPPLRVHGAVQIFAIDNPVSEGGIYHGTPVVYHAYVWRRPESYVNHPELKDRVRLHALPHLEEAENYACQNWPEEMVWDDAESVMHGELVHPGPDFRRVGCFTGWSRGVFPEMLAYDHEPTCEVLDDSITEISLWGPARAELACGRQPFASYFCSLCGGGIKESKCTFCDGTFNMPHTAAPWPYALPRIVSLAYEQCGYKWTIPTVEARKAEHRVWAEPGYVPEIPIEFRHFGKQQRSIEL
jgi:hypothetical protein